MKEQEMAIRNLIYKTIVGSKLYGTNTEDSDTDWIGIFVPSQDYTLGCLRCEQVEIKTNPSSNPAPNTKDDTDYVIYTVPKIFHMLLNNNPTALEIFFSPENCIVFDSKYGKMIRDNANIFVSKKAKHTFLGYAFAQKTKVLNKRDRYSQFVKALETLEMWKNKGEETLPMRLNLETDLIERGSWYACEKGTNIDMSLEAINKQLSKYGRRLEQVKRLGYDPKFICHVVRLLEEGLELLVEGKITFPLNSSKLVRDIKMGKYDLPTILKWIDEREKAIEDAYIHSKLPNTPDLDAINKLQIQILQDYYGGK